MSDCDRKRGFFSAVGCLLLTTTLSGLAASGANAATPYARAATPRPIDTGALDSQPASAPITVSVALRLRDLPSAEAYMRHVSTPGDALYGHFLTPARFRASFGPADADVARVTASLRGYGLTVERSGTTLLHVTGAPADLERAFQVSVHTYAVAARGSLSGYSFYAPTQAPTMPAGLGDLVSDVIGLDSRPAMHPHMHSVPDQLRASASQAGTPAGALPDMPGFYTVTDFADYYNVNPVYKAGVTGAGQTIGIVTFASFTPSDALTYWNGLGLQVSQTRITQIRVDGGAGAPSDEAGSDETTLDVEQSGGIAPGANVRVYVGPNTNQSFVDTFARAIDDDIAETISCSWGDWEIYNDVANAPVTNPVTGKASGTLTALHQLLVQAAVQGQSVIAAAGDNGAYDANDEQTPPDYSLALSVDYPASDSAITAAGGTTLPGTQTYTVKHHPDVVIDIPHERVWGWDYLLPLCTALKLDPVSCGILPVGGGGGISVHFPVPDYQKQLAGVRLSQANQVLIDEDVVPPKTIYTFPAGYAGRNVPDISVNADPETGYVIGYTSSAAGSTYGLETFIGGTSFSAPQINGVSQLLVQVAGRRFGLLNYMLYGLQQPYARPGAPLRIISAGGNEFYHGRAGYSPAAGLGTIDVANMAAELR